LKAMMRISRASLLDRQIRQMLYPDLKSIPCDGPERKAVFPRDWLYKDEWFFSVFVKQHEMTCCSVKCNDILILRNLEDA